MRDRWFHYLHITSGDQTLLCRREGRDIWQGLYEFPLIETPEAAAFETLLALPRFGELLGGAAWRLLRTIPLPKHQLSHQRIHATVYRIETPVLAPQAARLAVPTAAVGEYALPRLLDRYPDCLPDVADIDYIISIRRARPPSGRWPCAGR